MEWYTIENATGKETGNIYPQTDSMSPGYDLKGQNSVHNIPHNRFPDFNPDLDYFILHNNAKLTDVISTGFISASGFLLNDKVKNIFDQFQLPLHKYYPAKIMHRKILYDNYYWLHFGEDNSNLIDFKKSSFELKHPLPFFQDSVTPINDMTETQINELKKARPKESLFPSTIALIDKNNNSMLLFTIFWNKVYIDSRLRASLNNNITGLEIKKSDITIITP